MVCDDAAMNVVSFLRDTKSVGELSEIIVAAELARAGYGVALPLGENRRYDLIVDKDGVLSRVQVKTGRLRYGAVLFNCYSSHTHRSGTACRSYEGEVDFFGVYCAELRSVYLVPIADVARVRGSLRLTATRSGQSRKVRWAQAYLLPTVAAPDLTSVGPWARNGVSRSGSLVPS